MAQLMFGRFFWVWIVSFLGAASYLSALSINQLMRLSLTKKYKLPTINGGLLSDKDKKLSTNVILNGRNIFDPSGGMVVDAAKTEKKTDTKAEKRDVPVTQSTVPGCPPITLGQKIPESKERTIRLDGISYVEQDPEQSVAAVFVKVKSTSSKPPPRPIVKKTGKRGKRGKRRYYRRRKTTVSGKWRWQTEVFRIGGLMMEKMRICLINPQELIFFYQNKLQKLSLIKLKKKKRQRYYGSLGIKSKDDADGPGQVRVDAIDKRTISRSTVQDWLQNPMAHASSARIMPIRSGGLRLVWVRKKSLYDQLGLKTGDTLLSVNGKKLNVANALGLYSQLPYAKNLKVNIVRRGSRRQLFFNIK